MSLETLLEAAKYVEYRSQLKARGEEPQDYYTFSRASANNSDVITQSALAHQRRSLPSSTSSNSIDDTKERRRTTSSSTSRDSLLVQDHSGSGTREVHNKLEKNRRAHLKECFEALKKQLPNMDERKTSNLSILRGAIRCIQSLKRKERENEHDLEKLARDKIAFQQQVAALKKELSSQYDHIDVNALMAVDDNETTTTASECGGGSDLEDDFHNEISSTSNQNSRLASDDTSSLSSSNATGFACRSVTTTTAPTQALALPKQTSFSGLKVKNSTVFALEGLACGANKVLSRSSVEAHGLHPIDVGDGSINHSSRVLSTSSLQGMAGILATPHTVQVITPPSNIKLLTASNSLSSSTNCRQQGQIHVLTPSNVSYVATPPMASSNGKTVVAEPVHVGDSHCKPQQQSVSSMALVSTQAFVNITQAVSNSKPVIINQTSNFSEVMAPGSQLMKSSMFGPNVALTVKNSFQNNSGGEMMSSSSHSVLNPSFHSKPNQQLMQSSSPAQNVSSLISTEGGSLRQVAVSKAHSIASSSCNLLTHTSNMAQLVSQSPITVPTNQIVAPGVAPLVGSVSVVSHTGALHHHQILAQSQQLGKVIASPLLKSINQVNPIPIIQPQFLQAAGSNQHIVKPVVVVSMPNIIHPNSISPLTQRSLISNNEQCENVGGSAQSIQK